MRRLLLLALIAVGCAFGGALATVSPASAACGAGPLNADLTDAKLVVTGTVTEVGKRGERQLYGVTVQRVYKGTAAKAIEVLAPAADSDCALDVAKGEKWLFVAHNEKTPLVRADWGSQSLTEPVATQVADQLGSGKAPTAPAASADVTLSPFDPAEPYGYWQLAFPGAVLAAGGILVLLLARALGRSRQYGRS